MRKPESLKVTLRKVIELKIRGVDTPDVGPGTVDQETIRMAVETQGIFGQIDLVNRHPELELGREPRTILLTVRAGKDYTVETGELGEFIGKQQYSLKMLAEQLTTVAHLTLENIRPCPLQVSVAHDTPTETLAELERLATDMGFTVRVKPERLDMMSSEEALELALKQPHTRVA